MYPRDGRKKAMKGLGSCAVLQALGDGLGLLRGRLRIGCVEVRRALLEGFELVQLGR